MICLILTLFLTLIAKVSSVIHQQTQDTGLAGHFHPAILTFLFHKYLLQLSMASAQAIYEGLLLTFPWCRLWSASSCPKAWVSPTEKDTMSCLLVVLLTMQKHNQKKGLISGWQDKTFIFQITLVSQIKAKILSVLSIAWVEREKTHHRVFPWPPNPKQHWGRVTSCFFCAFSLNDGIMPDSYPTTCPRGWKRGRMSITTKFFLFFGHFFLAFPLWSIFSIAWIPTMNEASPTGAFSRATHPPSWSLPVEGS